MTQGTAAQQDPLLPIKMELVAAREKGQKGAFAAALAQYPAHAEELTAFYGALLATQGYEDVPLTAATEAVANRAAARAFAAVFGAAPVEQAAPVAVAQPAMATAGSSAITLKALRQAQRKSLREVASGLGLGVDVLSALEAGRIRASTVPSRLVQRLSAMLDTAAEQVQLMLAGPAQAPALLRSRQGEQKGGETHSEMSFDDAVRISAEMSAQEKSVWLAAE
jgi:transcriptional regulator with XRE-family HTH domain